MSTDPELTFPAPSFPQNPRLNAPIAPWWHTWIFIAIVIGLSVYQGRPSVVARATQLPSRIPIYIGTLVYELVLFGYAWLGLRLRGVRLREVIGGRWDRLADVLIDVATAILFTGVVWVALVILSLLLHFSGVEAAKPLLPQSLTELGAFVTLSVLAGFCEEFVFRGYFQRQFLAMTNTSWLAVALQAVIFGAAHLYQGWRGVVTITVYGALFGILAVMRKSLRPGMIQHAGQDALSGIGGYFLTKYRVI